MEELDLRSPFLQEIVQRRLSGVRASLPDWWPAALTMACLALVFASFMVTAVRVAPPTREQYADVALGALYVLLGVAVLPLALGRVKSLSLVKPKWLVVVSSTALSATPVVLLLLGRTTEANLIYRAQLVPHNPMPFVDLTMTLRSIWCAGQGFNVDDPLNGCIRPVYYGPGLNWLGVLNLPLNETWMAVTTGILLCLGGSLTLGLLAGMSRSLGGAVLLAGAFSASWLLLLERGNLDIIIFVVAVGVILLAYSRRALWAWSAAAVALWIMGTWKYYPFAMGVALLPVVRLRRGWIVLSGYALASGLFVLASMDAMRTSSSGQLAILSSPGNRSVDDYLELGRLLLVPRMSELGISSLTEPVATGLLLLVCAAALIWGVKWQRGSSSASGSSFGIAASGAAAYLAVVLVGGFGYGFKSAFLFMCVPLLSSQLFSREGFRSYSSVYQLLLVLAACMFVSNGTLTTLSGLVVASFALGAALVGIFAYIPLDHRRWAFWNTKSQSSRTLAQDVRQGADFDSGTAL